PLVYLKQGLAYLAGCSADGELPTQRLLNKPVKIGNTIVYVTRGKTLSLGSLSLTLPVLSTPHSPTPACDTGPQRPKSAGEPVDQR
ncbi:MAG TPA: hypothetical protein VH520_06130, partial [Streptosporangiaceae bacterium]